MEKINDRQLAILCFVSLLGMKLLNLPSLLFADYSWGGIFILITYLVLDLLTIFIILKVKKLNDNLSFFELLKKYLSKPVAYFLFFLIICFCFLKISYIFFEYHNYLSHSLTLSFKKFTLLFIVLPVVNALVYRGIKAFARTTEFFYPFLLIGLVLILILGVFTQNIFAFTPLKDISYFFEGLGKRSMWFGDGIIILILIDSIQIKKTTKKKVLLDVLFLSLMVVLFYFAYYLIYQSTSYIHAYAISDIIQFSTKFGNVGKLDIIAIMVAIFMLIFEMAIYSLCLEKCIEKFVKKKFITFVIIDITLIILIYIIFHNLTGLINLFTSYGYILAFIICYLLPFIVMLLSLINKRRVKK